MGILEQLSKKLTENTIASNSCSLWLQNVSEQLALMHQDYQELEKKLDERDRE